MSEGYRCKICKVHDEMNKSEQPACCAWFIINVVCGDKTIEECTAYIPKEDRDAEG